jgi:hypothetical protein
MEQKWSKPKTGRLQVLGFLERETGIGPATNSLEGCDSTTELLPLTNIFYPTCRYWAPRLRSTVLTV